MIEDIFHLLIIMLIALCSIYFSRKDSQSAAKWYRRLKVVDADPRAFEIAIKLMASIMIIFSLIGIIINIVRCSSQQQ